MSVAILPTAHPIELRQPFNVCSRDPNEVRPAFFSQRPPRPRDERYVEDSAAEFESVVHELVVRGRLGCKRIA